MDTRYEFYRDRAGEWRWRAVAAENGKKLGDSGEGYRDRSDAEAALSRILQSPRVGAEIVILEGGEEA